MAERITSPSTQALEQAMEILQSMFPSMDAEIFVAVLEANHGSLDSAIDQLLTMTEGSREEDQHQMSSGSRPEEGATGTTPSSLRQTESDPSVLRSLVNDFFKMGLDTTCPEVQHRRRHDRELVDCESRFGRSEEREIGQASVNQCQSSQIQFDHELAFHVPESGEENSQFENCQKNPGHTNMIPVTDFKLGDLPEGWRDPWLFLAIMMWSQRVVKIIVRYISEGRPDKYCNSDLRGMHCTTAGSGECMLDEELLSADPIECPLPNCKEPKPHKTTPVFEVQTATHVVFNNEETQHSELEFFFNSENDVKEGNVVKGQMLRVEGSGVEIDKCILHCVSHDLDLFKKMDELPPYPSVLSAAQISENPSPLSWFKEKSRDPLVVIISHPHGAKKYISLGTWGNFIPDTGACTEEEWKNEKMKDDLRDMEEINPRYLEEGVTLDGWKDRVFMSPRLIQEMKQFVDKNPEGSWYDFDLQRKGRVSSFTYDGSITYTTATCPGSSGAPVHVYLPGQHKDEPWIQAGEGCHFKHCHFDKSLNQSGKVSFYRKHEQQLKPYIEKIERKKEKK